MKALKKVIPAAIGALFLATSVQATTIDFTGLLNTTDPTVGLVSFSAGNPADFNDTIVAGANEYLLSGRADGLNGSPSFGPDSSYIGVAKSGTLFGSVSFDIASDIGNPSGTTLWVEAYLSGNLVASSFIFVSDSNDHSLSLAALDLTSGADSLRIYDDLDTFDVGDPFHIDNFVFADYVAPCTGPGCNPNPNPVPEPASMLLLGAGMAGLAFSRRRKSA